MNASDANELAAATADYLEVTAANSTAYAAKLAADAVYEKVHARWGVAGREYAGLAFRLTAGPDRERIVVTAAGALICRAGGDPGGTGRTYWVDHAPVAATVPPA